MNTLFHGAQLLPGGDDWSAMRDVDVLVVDGVIAEIGQRLAASPNTTIVEASSLVLAPAFANAHTHSPEMLARGLMPMGTQPEWLAQAYACGQDSLCDQDIARAVRLCATEIVRGGGVRVTDHYRQIPIRLQAVRVAAEAWAASGLQARIAMTVRDRVAPNGGLVNVPKSAGMVPSTSEVLGLCADLLDGPQPVPLGLGPSAPHRVTDELLVGLVALMRAKGSFLHMHLCESAEDTQDCRALYGQSAVAHLHKLGVLDSGVELVHAVHVDDADLSLIASCGAKIVHSPVANLRLGAGVAPMARALAHGVEVALGTDGAGSNDSQSLLEAAKFAMLAPRATWPASEWLAPTQVLRMATSGARIVPGAPADLIAFDGGASAFVNVRDDWSARLVLAARETDIVHVMGRGGFLMRDRVVSLP